MGNRVSSGSTGDFSVHVFQVQGASTLGDEDDEFAVSIGKATYAGGGEYIAEYNVTTAGNYSLHVSKRNP